MEGTQRCQGCGAPLQQTDETQPGYVDTQALARSNALCRRCYRLKHYGEFTVVEMSEETYQSALAPLLLRKGHVFYVIDVFDVSGSILPELHKYVVGSPVTVLVNKIDLLPREIDPASLAAWIRGLIEDEGISVENLLFVSGQTNQGLDDVIQTLESHALADDAPIYVAGAANVGKSTLLNRLLQRLTGDEPLTASRMPGTTLGNVETQVSLPSGHALSMVDTPGFVRGRRVVDVLCPDCLKRVVPRSRLKPKVYQVNAEQSLLLGGMARIDFEQGIRQSIVIYASNDVVIHRTKLSHADEIATKHADDILQVPCPACRAKLGAFQSYPVAAGKFRKSIRHPSAMKAFANGCDLVIPGLGWIALHGKDFLGTLWIRGEVKPSVRRRLIGDLSRLT